jgi:hypothetical protein
VSSQALTSVAQFVQRDEVNVRLRALVYDLLPRGKLAFVTVKRLKFALSSSSTFSALIWSKIQTSPTTVYDLLSPISDLGDCPSSILDGMSLSLIGASAA